MSTPWFRPVVIAVCGSPAAGKTTIASAISDQLRLPRVSRDDLASGLRLRANGGFEPDLVRQSAETAMIATAQALATAGVSFVLESSVLDNAHLGPLAALRARLLVVHVTAPPSVVRQRLRERVASGDAGTQRLLEQHESGVMTAEIFAPSSLADRVITVDTSTGATVAEHVEAISGALERLLE